MKQLSNVVSMTDLSPNGTKLNYLLSEGRVYASAKSWLRALQVPECMKAWFESGLTRTAMLKKDFAGGNLEMNHLNTPVYRWHAVGELIRSFDREWYKTQFKTRPLNEQREIEKFHEHYERLVSWGYDLQERALTSVLNASNDRATPVTQENLLEAIKQAIAPRLRVHDDKLYEHDIVISEIKDSVPTLRDQEEFISVKQAISEQGLDPTQMTLHPTSRENLSGLTGQILKSRGHTQGPSIIARIDGHSISKEMKTYKRGEIYAVLSEIMHNKQHGLPFAL